MADVKHITTGYQPRPLQAKFHKELRRFNVLVCHRRFGKTVFSINDQIDWALRNPLANPQYAYLAPTYKQAKTICWPHLINYTKPIPGADQNKSELTVYINRSWRTDPVTGEPAPDVLKIMLLGAEDPDSLRGIYLDGIIFDEYAQCDPIIWGEIVRPALSDRGEEAKRLGLYDHPDYKEPWATFIGTPKGQNHFYKMYMRAAEAQTYCTNYEARHIVADEVGDWAEFETKWGLNAPGITMEARAAILKKIAPAVLEKYTGWREYLTSLSWYSAIYKASETGVLSPEEIESMMADMDEEDVEQELECSFTAAIKGSYYGRLLTEATTAGRIGTYPHDPRYPVDTHWDIGVGDKTTIWFRQKINGLFYYIDYFEFNGEGIEFYKRVLDAKAESVGVRREVKSGTTIMGRGFKYGRHVWPHDGAAKDFSTGNTRQETARKMGLVVEIGAKVARGDKIDASRNMLKVCFFDAEACARGLECLYNYQKIWDGVKGVFKDEPLHDWSSHGADGFAYSSLDTRDSKAISFTGMYSEVKRQARMAYNELNC